MDPNKRHRPIRHATERVLNAVLGGGRLAGLSYRLGGMGRVGVTRHEIVLDAATSLPRPLRVGFASDFHAGPTTHPALFDELLVNIAEEAPDVLLLGGDYVSFDAANVTILGDFLARASRLAPLGTYAVLGNHDVWNGAQAVTRALQGAGAEVLVNRSVALPAPFGEVSICGIDDPWTGQPSVPDTFRGAGPVRIYLMHSPDGLWLVEGEGQRFELGFAGHTHGGQIARRNGAPLFRPSGPYSRKYHHGRFDIDNNGPLLVSRGVGCAGIPLRLHADPELLICTLR